MKSVFKILVFGLMASMLWVSVSNAQEFEGGQRSLKGLALVHIESRRSNLEIDQAIVIRDELATFVGLNDFGGESFRIMFSPKGMTFVSAGQVTQTSGKKLKKLISLPLSQQEFLAVLRYRAIEGFDVSKSQDHVLWTHQKHKKLVVKFSNFKGKTDRYPYSIVIKNKKNKLSFDWNQIQFEKPKKGYRPLPE